VMYTALYSYLLGWVVTSIGLALPSASCRTRCDLSRIRYRFSSRLALLGLWSSSAPPRWQQSRSSLGWNSRSIRKRVRAFADNDLDDLLDEC